MRKFLALFLIATALSSCAVFEEIGSWFGCDGSPDLVEQQALDQNFRNVEQITEYNEEMLEAVTLEDEMEAACHEQNLKSLALAKKMAHNAEEFGSSNLVLNYKYVIEISTQNKVLNKEAGIHELVAESREELCEQARELAKTLSDN